MTRPGGGLAAADIVTLLFTDVVGSTELLQRLGDDTAETVRRSHFRLLREVVAVHGGHEVKSLGDGLMVVFGSALDALRSAVAIQQAVSRHNRSGEGPPFEVRVGLHAGEAIRDEDDYFGTPVVVAKRLCDTAQGGQILASQLLAGLVGSRGGFELRPLGPLELKGIVEPVHTVEVAWVAERPEAAVQAGDGATPAAGVRLLGPLEVVAAESPECGLASRVVEIGSAKQRAVLAVLALHINEVVSRELLLDRLWGDGPPASATVTLRSLVSRLRRAIDGAAVGFEIVTREPGWILRGEPGVVDAARFEALTAEARILLAADDPAAAVVTLRGALQLWRGAALVDIVDAGYLAAEATHLDAARLDAVEDLVDAELASGRPAEALARLEPHVASNPLRERAWGQLMVALYHLGRQAEALRAFQRLRALLREELGIDPTPALSELEARILRHDPALAPPPAIPGLPGEGPTADRIAAAVPASGPSLSAGNAERTPFVGRVAERATLSAALELARAVGSGGMVLIGGEPGIGKTRLAEEAAAEAAEAGMNVLVGHSYEMAGAAPYPAIVEILEAALAAAPSPEAFVADVLGDAAPEIARLVPQLRRRFPDLPPPLELPPAQERQYLFRCLGDILARLSKARPLLVVLDDLQWADDATLLFVEHLAPQLPGLALLVVATYRDSDVGRPLARLFGDLHRRRLATRLSLGALTTAEAGELVAGLVGQDPPPGLVDALHAATEGNVFFLEEMVRDLAESGQAFDDTGRFRAGVDVDELRLPEGVRLVIERRLDRLSDPARQALTAAAVAGRVFTVRLLQTIGDLDADDLLDIVDEAEQAVLIAPTANDDEFLFAHELIRQTLVGGLSGPRRRRLHARAAEALEQVHAREPRTGAATIAHHLLQAGPAADPKRTFGYLKMAAESAMETSAFEEAVRHFESALLLPDAATTRELADLRSGLGLAQRSLGQAEEAIANWRQAIDAYEALGDEEAIGRVCLTASWSLALLARFGDAAEMNQRGLAALGERISADRGRLLGMAGTLAGFGGSYQAGADMLEEELRLAAQLQDDALLGHGLLCKALHRMSHMEHRDLVDAGLRAAELLRGSGDLWRATDALAVVLYSLISLGRFDEARSISQEVEPLAERFGNYFGMLQYRRTNALVDFFVDGDLDQLERFAGRDREFCEALGQWKNGSWSWLALAQFLRGNWDEARSLWEEAVRLEPPGCFDGWNASLLFECLAYRGEKSEALAQLDSRALPKPGEPKQWGPASMLMAGVEGLVILGEQDRAAGLYPAVVDCYDRTGALCGTFDDGRLIHRAAGIAAAAGRQWEAAEEHFRTALRQASDLPHRLEGAHTRRWYGRMLLERDRPGDRRQAEGLLQAAASDYQRMGMPRHVELAVLS